MKRIAIRANASYLDVDGRADGSETDVGPDNAAVRFVLACFVFGSLVLWTGVTYELAKLASTSEGTPEDWSNIRFGPVGSTVNV